MSNGPGGEYLQPRKENRSAQSRSRTAHGTNRMRWMTPPLRMALTALAGLSLAIVISGCQIASTPSRPMHFHARQLELHRDALAEFPVADYVKPAPDQLGGMLDTLAPLLVQQRTAGNDDGPEDEFGIVYDAGQTGLEVDASRPVIYAEHTTADVAGNQVGAYTYWWRYANAGQWVGLQVITLPDNTPIAWVPVSSEWRKYGTQHACRRKAGSDQRERRVFVASTCESAAREAGLEPPPGRLFAVDTPLPDGKNTFVARLTAPGPVPMGPYVYLARNTPRGDGKDTTGRQTRDDSHDHMQDGPTFRISSVICRCMSSQAYEYASENRYELLPLEDVPANWVGKLRRSARHALTSPGLSARLEPCVSPNVRHVSDPNHETGPSVRSVARPGPQHRP